MRLRKWQKAALVACAVLFVLYMTSLGFPAEHHVCASNYEGDPEHCPQYHLGNAVFLWTVGMGDAHNGLITAIATCLLAWITLRLATMERESGITRRAELRAYIYGKGVKVRQEVGTDTIGNPIVVGYTFWLPYENFGNTPAHRVRCNAARLKFPMNTEMEFPAVEWGYHNSVMAGPGEKLITPALEISSAEALGCWNREMEICLQFYFEYVDVFDANDVKITSYEVRLDPVLNPKTVVDEGNKVFLIIPYGRNNMAT